MKLGRFVLCLLMIVYIIQSSTGQSQNLFANSFTEATTNQGKFGIYIDTISKYIYRDADIAKTGLTECQKLLDSGTQPTDQQKFDFAAYKILYLHNMDQPLDAYQMVHQCQLYLDSLNIPNSDIEYFYYLKSFTYMKIGDLESAQRTYYDNLERARINQDTASMLQSFYSLGQFYNNQQKYTEAVLTLEQSKENITAETHPQTQVLVLTELGEAYDGIKKTEQALNLLQSTYQLADTNNLEILKYECLIKKGNIYLKNKRLSEAEEIHDVLDHNMGKFQDQQLLSFTKLFQANYYRARKNHTRAVRTFEELIATTDSTQHDLLLELYTNLHEINKEINHHAAAYDYLLTYTKIKKQQDEDARRQKTNYLKIKFDTEKKDKENIVLAAEIVKNKAESKLLYMWLALLFLILALAIVAFIQKRKYSKNLETEVQKRTLNLKESNILLNKSNQELKNFNHLLSHDLKEPIRSIVSFSQLATRGISDNHKIKDYLNFVVNSGQQLQNLIHSINTFQKIDKINFCDFVSLDLEATLNNTCKFLEKKYPGKQIQLTGNFDVSLFLVYVPFVSIINIVLKNSVNFNKNKIVKIQVEHVRENEKHLITIRDNGIGIDKKYHHKIFGMLARLHDRESYSGSGMGLSIAKKLTERMSGTITVVASDQQNGSTFLISLPHNTASVKAAPTPLNVEAQ